ncbi:hypothetical protein DFH27DRAFT_527993 [Peziza echinospora]|nr:hypothetical protein DFH27DRAFT_527993 [Peziza echinospora]
MWRVIKYSVDLGPTLDVQWQYEYRPSGVKHKLHCTQGYKLAICSDTNGGHGYAVRAKTGRLVKDRNPTVAAIRTPPHPRPHPYPHLSAPPPPHIPSLAIQPAWVSAEDYPLQLIHKLCRRFCDVLKQSFKEVEDNLVDEASEEDEGDAGGDGGHGSDGNSDNDNHDNQDQSFTQHLQADPDDSDHNNDTGGDTHDNKSPDEAEGGKNAHGSDANHDNHDDQDCRLLGARVLALLQYRPSANDANIDKDMNSDDYLAIGLDSTPNARSLYASTFLCKTLGVPRAEWRAVFAAASTITRPKDDHQKQSQSHRHVCREGDNKAKAFRKRLCWVEGKGGRHMLGLTVSAWSEDFHTFVVFVVVVVVVVAVAVNLVFVSVAAHKYMGITMRIVSNIAIVESDDFLVPILEGGDLAPSTCLASATSQHHNIGGDALALQPVTRAADLNPPSPEHSIRSFNSFQNSTPNPFGGYRPYRFAHRQHAIPRPTSLDNSGQHHPLTKTHPSQKPVPCAVYA